MAENMCIFKEGAITDFCNGTRTSSSEPRYHRRTTRSGVCVYLSSGNTYIPATPRFISLNKVYSLRSRLFEASLQSGILMLKNLATKDLVVLKDSVLTIYNDGKLVKPAEFVTMPGDLTGTAVIRNNMASRDNFSWDNPQFKNFLKSHGIISALYQDPNILYNVSKDDTLLTDGQQVAYTFEKQNVVLVNATWSILVEKRIEGNCKISKCTFRSFQNPTTLKLPHVDI